jgi:hypothetical protein
MFRRNDLLPLEHVHSVAQPWHRHWADLSILSLLTNLVLFDCGDEPDKTLIFGLDIQDDGYDRQ